MRACRLWASLADTLHRWPRWPIGEHRRQVPLGEAPGHGRLGEGLVDSVRAGQLGQGHGVCHLRPHPAGPGGPGLSEPQRCSWPDGQELSLGGILRHRRTGERRLWRGREVLGVDPRVARGGQLVAGDLCWPGRPNVGQAPPRCPGGAPRRSCWPYPIAPSTGTSPGSPWTCPGQPSWPRRKRWRRGELAGGAGGAAPRRASLPAPGG